MRSVILGCVLGFVASALVAQGTIFDGDVNFVRTASSFDSTPDANFVGVGGPSAGDALYEHGWWFRLAGATQETSFGVPGIEAYVGVESFLNWFGLGGGAFDALETAFVGDGDGAGTPTLGFVRIDLEIVNTSTTNPLSLQLFHVFDVDAGGTEGSDTATLDAFDPLRVLRIDDAGGATLTYREVGDSSAFLVRPFGATSVRSVLNDAQVTNFDNSGIPFPSGDFTAGFQFPITLAPSGSTVVRVYLDAEYSQTTQCNHIDGLFCDSFEVGSTLAWSSSTP